MIRSAARTGLTRLASLKVYRRNNFTWALAGPAVRRMRSRWAGCYSPTQFGSWCLPSAAESGSFLCSTPDVRLVPESSAAAWIGRWRTGRLHVRWEAVRVLLIVNFGIGLGAVAELVADDHAPYPALRQRLIAKVIADFAIEANRPRRALASRGRRKFGPEATTPRRTLLVGLLSQSWG